MTWTLPCSQPWSLSSSPRAWVQGYLEKLGLFGCFERVVCADDVRRTKPEPDLYLRVLDLLGVRADEAIALEDSPNGVLAAKRAGLFCIAVPNAVTCRLCFDRVSMPTSSSRRPDRRSIATARWARLFTSRRWRRCGARQDQTGRSIEGDPVSKRHAGRQSPHRGAVR